MPTASHPFSQEEIMAYLDGELSPERALLAARHLERCADCQYLTSSLRNVSEKLAGWEIDAPQSSLPWLVAAASAQRKRGFWKWPSFAPAYLALAGAVIAFVLIPVLRKPTVTVRHTVPLPAQSRAEDLPATPGSAAKEQVRLAADSKPAPVSGPLIVRTAQLRLTSRNFAQSRSEVERIAKSHQGYISQLELDAPVGSGHSLSVSLRVPAAQLDGVLQELKKLGHVDGESQRGEDVTQRYVDGNARLSNLRTTEERLRQILRERTGKLADVLEVEEAISQTRGQIEVAEAEQKALSNQIALATVQLNIAEEYHAALQGNSGSALARLRNAAVDGYRNLAGGIMGVLVFLLSAGPVLLLLVAAFFPARWLWRKWRRSGIRPA